MCDNVLSVVCGCLLTQNISPSLDRQVYKGVEDGEGHEGDDAGDDEAQAEVDVDDVFLVQAHRRRTNAKLESGLKQD